MMGLLPLATGGLLLLLLTEYSLAGCPPNYELINNICFGLRSAASLNFDQADKLCHQDHTRLARVEPDQLPLLVKILPRGARAWIGLRFDKTRHRWIWTKDHSSADMTMAYLGALDLNATEEDDCAVIRLKKNALNIESDTCADTWVNTALCSMEKESCGYSATTNLGVCEFDANETCSKKAVYELDDGTLPKHMNSCQVDDVDCRVVFNRSTTDGGAIGCSVECGDNVDKTVNDTFTVTDDCKKFLMVKNCDCAEAALALANASARTPNRLGLYIGVAMLSVIALVLLIGVAAGLIRNRMKRHTERIHPPPTTVRYSVDPVKFRSGGTDPY